MGSKTIRSRGGGAKVAGGALCLLLALVPGLPYASEASLEKARIHVQAAQEHFLARKYHQAVAELERALAFAPRDKMADIHYNLAKCFEKMHEPSRAIFHYQLYMVLVPEASDKEEIGRTIAGLRAKMEEREGWGLWQWGIVTAGLGVAVGTGGAVMWGLAQGSVEGANNAIAAGDGSLALEAQRRAKTEALVGNIVFSVAMAAVASGMIMAIYDWSTSPKGQDKVAWPSLDLGGGPLDGGGMVTLQGRF